MNKIILLLVFVFSIFNSNAQKCSPYFFDTLSLTIDDELEIKLALDDFWKIDTTAVLSNLKALDSMIQTNHQFVPFKNYKVIDCFQSIDIEEMNQGDIYSFTESGLVQKNKAITIKQCRYDYTALIELKSVNSIRRSDFYTKLHEVIDSQYQRKKLLGIPNYHYVDTALIKSNYGNMIQFLISPAIGLDMIKNQPVTHLSFVMFFDVTMNQIKRGYLGASYSIHNIFPESESIQYNNFIDILYGFNRSKDKKEGRWEEVNVGYLVRRNGDFFDQNTFRFGVSSIHGRVKVSGYLYVTNDWNNFYPSVGITFR
jgi:hypothetical protein